MIQKILKVGTSAAVTLPKHSLEELGVRIGDNVEVDVRGEAVIVRAAKKRSARDKKITELTLNFIERYRKDLEALAN